MESSTTTNLPIPSILPSATKYCSSNHLASGYLFFDRQACDHNCTAVFVKSSVKIFKSIEVNINALCPPIIQGHRNSPLKPIYSVSLPIHPPSTHKSNGTINVSLIRYFIDFHHSALFSPNF